MKPTTGQAPSSQKTRAADQVEPAIVPITMRKPWRDRSGAASARRELVSVSAMLGSNAQSG